MKRTKVISVERDERGDVWLGPLVFEGKRGRVNLSAEHVAETLLVTLRKWAAEALVEPPAEGPKKKLEELEAGDKVVVGSYHRKRIASIEA